MEKVYKILSGCNDFNALEENLSDDILELFEEQLDKYLNCTEDEEYEKYLETDEEPNYPDIVRWYEGLISTEELLSDWREC